MKRKKSKPTPYKNFKIDGGVVDILGMLPKETANCLVKAFKKIALGEARLLPDTIISNLQACEYCGYTILVSVMPDKGSAVVVDIAHARNHLAGLWK